MYNMLRTTVFAVSVAIAASAATFNNDLAVQMVHYAGAAYCPTDTVRAWNSSCHQCQEVEPGFNMFFVAFDESSNTQGYVGYSPLLDRVVVAFRGTVGSSVKNIYEDLMAWKSQSTFGRCGDCEVHSGFLKDHNALHPQIVHGVTLALQAHPGVPIIVTGHSLGAAMATLSAAALVDDSYVVEAVYTQGQPRVGDSLFASWYNSIMPYHYRAVHKEDPIPHCPPTFSPFDFHHVPQEFWYNDKHNATNFIECSATNGEDESCSDQLHIWQYADKPGDHLIYLGVPIGTDAC